MSADMPMPPEEYARLLAERRATPGPEPLQPVPSREPAATTDSLAAELLAEATERPLETGELLLVSEEATLNDLEAAAAAVPGRATLPELPADDPVLGALSAPRLANPRVWAAMGWDPPLAEHLRLVQAAVQSGATVPQIMLVGHVETFPERLEHLARLRELLNDADGRGDVALAVRQATADDLPAPSPTLTAILDGARPADPDVDRRHALAMARLVLGPGRVVDS